MDYSSLLRRASNIGANLFHRRLLIWIAALTAFATVQVAAAAETVTYYYTNPQGTPLATTDSAGNITSASEYRPYGSQVSGVAAAGPGYTGHVNDPDSGLVYMQARYYDPAIGRFLSVDPVSDQAGDLFALARYTYAGNNPVVNIDPDGRQMFGQPTHIDWDDPQMQRGAAVVMPELGSMIPVVSVGICVANGCSGGGWASAAITTVIPGEGTAAKGLTLGKRAFSQLFENASRGKKFENLVRDTITIGDKTALRMNGADRVPDGFIFDVSISEVKNVSKLSYTKQLRDYTQFAKGSGIKFNLYTPPGTTMTKPLLEAIKNGDINHVVIPFG
ncbi:RHS repeat-associated protein [Luteibacter rhizovicinus]|uniref:RHS repeat-associated protein n=1 Tax=Luteibacter rhizovicinus TaxID=242606 RepID=A0A4R3YLY9_9GAMM|nr:RHS repeat-associated core domain-containing protein [Luteibacter rhizovicinus]TCV92074.1 RHS repeat-associated protein [Luteibacter rhizovicinus]